jgi:hypothetical protein
MATCTLTTTAKGFLGVTSSERGEAPKSNRDRYYDAPTAIRNGTLGVTRIELNLCEDEYCGTASALAEAGLLPIERFPGMPGQNAVSSVLRPRNAVRADGERWNTTPGRMWVCRQLDGGFRVNLVVSYDEQDRRHAAKTARESAAEAAAEAVLKELPAHQRRYLEEVVRCQGTVHCAEQWFRDSEWLALEKIDRRTAVAVLRGLDVFRRADIERDLMLRPLKDAADIIDRIRVQHG